MQVIEYNTGRGTIQIHKVGCKDIAGHPAHLASPLEATSYQQMVEEIYPPSDFGYEGDEWTSYAADVRLMPCCPEMPYREGEQVATATEPAAPKASRRPQLNHKACSHAQTPKARRECRKAFWAAKAVEQAAPVLTATYTGLVEWDGRDGKVRQGTIIRDMGTGRMLVRTNSQRPTPVQVAFAALRLAA